MALEGELPLPSSCPWRRGWGKGWVNWCCSSHSGRCGADANLKGLSWRKQRASRPGSAPLPRRGGGGEEGLQPGTPLRSQSVPNPAASQHHPRGPWDGRKALGGRGSGASCPRACPHPCPVAPPPQGSRFSWDRGLAGGTLDARPARAGEQDSRLRWPRGPPAGGSPGCGTAVPEGRQRRWSWGQQHPPPRAARLGMLGWGGC